MGNTLCGLRAKGAIGHKRIKNEKTFFETTCENKAKSQIDSNFNSNV